MKKLLEVLLSGIVILFFSYSANSQTASVTWPLSVTTTIYPTNSGNVNGENESFNNMVINNYTGPNSSQRVTTTDGSWPAETVQNENRYIQFAVSPNVNYSFEINSISLSLGASGGSNMKVNIWYSLDPTFTTRTQLNSSVLSLPNGSLLSLSYSSNVLVNSGLTFYLRIYPWYTTSATGKYICPQNVIISGTTSGALAQITISVSSLSNFSHVIDTPSIFQTYTVSGSNLIDNVIITPPIGFELSTDAGLNWFGNTSPINLPQSNGEIIGQPVTVFVRLNGSSAAEYSGNISHTSTGAITQNIFVSGVTLASEPTIQSSISFGTITSNSIVVNFTGGNGQRRILAVKFANPVSWNPTDGSAISGVNSNFSLAIDQANGNRVVYDGSGNTVTVNGLSQNSTYYFSIFEYNVGSGNSQNYLTLSPGTGTQTTLAEPTIVVTPSSLSFGNVDINTYSEEKVYLIMGSSLEPSSGNITVIAPAGFEISLTQGSGFASTLGIPYSGGTLSSTPIYVRFFPTTIMNYGGNITNSGGGATTQIVSVTGNGIGPAQPNLFQAEEALIISSYVMSEYPGYTGTGYVDIGDKTGSSVEFTFRRETASSDTVTIRYALGASTRSMTILLNDVNVGTVSFTTTGSWTSWSSVQKILNFNAGLNRLKFILTTNAVGPNIDNIKIGGQNATPMYKLTLLVSGNGNVTVNPSSEFYEIGTNVQLTAIPLSGYVFTRWSGTEPSTSNPLNITMNSHKTQIAVIAPQGGFVPSFPYQNKPSGFASVNALGNPEGTTGGSGPNASVVYVTNSDSLNKLMIRRVDPNRSLNFPPLTVYIVGNLSVGSTFTSMLDVKDAYDISIIGVGSNAGLTGFGLNIVRSSNIIVRNLKIQNSPDDGINIDAGDSETKGHHIWIDHCTFTNCYDGALDVTHAAAYVTISWNHFYNHDKTSLSGNSDNLSTDTQMKVTYHHNYFDSTGQRHPRVRFGKVHVFNNYYRKNTLYGVSSNCEADVVVEGNYFYNVPIPYESLRVGTSYPGDLVARNNILAGTTGSGSTRGIAFEPTMFYNYTVNDPANIPTLLTTYAGSGKYDFSYESFTTKFNLNVTAVNGTVLKNPSLSEYDSGQVVQLIAIPNSGYHFVNWSGDLSTTENPTTIIMNSNKNVTANFSINQYQITATSSENGTISPYGLITVNYGDSLAFIFTPLDGYHVDSVFVDGVYIGNMGSYVFYNINSNHAIHVKFAINKYTILATSGENGSIVPSGTIIVEHGMSQTFNFIPDSGYEVDSVFIDGDYYGKPAMYEFQNISSSHTIHVKFVKINAEMEISLYVNAGWNMISVPIKVNDYRRNVLFPNSISNAYSFDNGYNAVDTLRNGIGYWLKFPEPAEISIIGTAVDSNTIDVKTGWNMIGSINVPIPVSAIVPDTDVTIVSPFYGYENGYKTTDALYPGKAYWVKVVGNGKLYLNINE